MNKSKLLLLLNVIPFLVFSQQKTELQKDSLEMDGIYRSFEYLVPEGIESGQSLVFVLHGSNGDVSSTRMFTGYEFEKIVNDRKNAILVYPNGYDRHWNDCRKTASYKANQEDIDDITFFEKMITYFQKTHGINPNRVFVTGISNGGQMCYKLAYEMPEKFKGIAPFVANIPEDFNNDCTPKNVATSVLIINGTTDPINPDDGGWVVIEQDSSRGAVLSTHKTVDYWKNLLPCEPEMEQIEYSDYALDDDSSVIRYQYLCTEENKKVELLKIIGGGHTVPLMDTPPIPERFKKIVGNKNRDVNAPRIVMDFFESLN